MQSHTVLLLKSPVLADPAVQQLVRERFTAYGIGPERLRLEGPGSRVQMLETYQRIDIALDPFPFGGGITTLEALWMGVPVVSLRGDRFAGRATASFLRTLELDSLVTDTLEDYKHTVVKLIADDAYRIRLRSELRERMLASAIGDTGLFTREYESTLRSAWLAKQ